MSEPWQAERWRDASDPPEYADHNARMRYEAERTAIFHALIAAIEGAAEAFAGIGLAADDVGDWIVSAVELSDWAAYCAAVAT